jgi:hypothetical protein
MVVQQPDAPRRVGLRQRLQGQEGQQGGEATPPEDCCDRINAAHDLSLHLD